MAEWRENQLPTPTERPENWVMYFDGSLKLEGAGARVLLISLETERPENWVNWVRTQNESNLLKTGGNKDR
jgi:hypothetical protein